MINFRISIENPWWDRFENIKCWAGETPFKHKFWEVQIMKSDDILAVDARVTTHCDHAGAELWVGILGYAINLHFYDNRHWNYEEGRWKFYTENEGYH